MCITAVNSPFNTPNPQLKQPREQVLRGQVTRPGPPAEPDRWPLPPGCLPSLVYRLLRTLGGRGRAGSAPGRVSPPAKRREEEPKGPSQRPRGVGWHLEEGRWRVTGSRESAMGGGVGSGTRAGEGHCRTSLGHSCPLPPRAGFTRGGAAWEVGSACARKGTHSRSGAWSGAAAWRRGATTRTTPSCRVGPLLPAASLAESAAGRAPPGGRRRGSRRLRSRAALEVC